MTTLVPHGRLRTPAGATSLPVSGASSGWVSPGTRSVTLIEWLVLVLVLAAVASIAVPSYRRHSLDLVRGQLAEDLLSADRAMERAGVGLGGDYTLGGAVTLGDILSGPRTTTAGSDPVVVTVPSTPGTTITVARLTSSTFCLEATTDALPGEAWSLVKDARSAQQGRCP